MSIFRCLLFILIAGASGMVWSADSQMPHPLSSARQLVLVRAANWGSTSGTLQLFQRSRQSVVWQPVGSPFKVSLGRTGLGWGQGLHNASHIAGGPIKREGDGRATAGAFGITALFGYLGPHSRVVRTAKMPYLEVTPDLLCIDDVSSRYYNQLIRRSQQHSPDWKTHEDMRRTDGLYAWGAVVAHNVNPIQPQAGSCIFLHVWEGDGVPTSGCTAGAALDIARVFLWLNADAMPVLVQLPESEYSRLKADWRLP